MLQLDLPLFRDAPSPAGLQDVAISHALIIREPWVSLILSGKKTWEIRGSNTARRGRIGLIRSRSLSVVGHCVLQDSIGPLELDDLLKFTEKHRIPRDELLSAGLPYRRTFAWIMADPVYFETPRPYRHRSGAVIWARIT